MHKETIIIFSHWFGIRSWSYALFSDLIEIFDNLWIISILTEYCEYNEETHEVFVKPFSEQAAILQKTIDETYQEHPNADIILIGQSQWSTIISLCDTSKIQKIIFIAPFFHTNQEDVIDRYSQSIWTTINLEGLSYRKRSDWTTTIIPANHWKERFETNIIDLYNKKALSNSLYIFYGLQDQVMKFSDYERIKNAFIMNLDGNHDFSNEYRDKLIENIINLITQ